MTGNEIRQKFLDYFEQRGHKIVQSSPVFPPNDPTILFTNAGMNQFKDVFLGNEKREYKRAVSSQKCIRAGGKHNDLDEVGKTARHHTFFEMLGNFSFGDYFKEDAIKFAWDFLTGSIEEGKLGLNPNHLWFTYFEGNAQVPADTEARDLWIKVGAKPEQVLPFDAKDNFWQMGDTGPCGPCSEIHYYMGDEPDNPEKNRSEFVNAETGDETIEIWNLVFMQFNRIGIGEQFINEKNQFVYPSYELKNLPAPSVDTGAGLERIAAVMQGKSNNYDTDLLLPIIKDCIANLADKHYEYDTPEGFAMRVVADHARATAFAIADGVLPGNEGRSYVLRKIMRRAIYHGREHLGFNDLFFYKVCDFVVNQMKDAFPELEVQRDFIGKMVRLEEERFGATMTVGLEKLQALIREYSKTPISVERLAQLYDTFGTPIDLIYHIISEHKLFVGNRENPNLNPNIEELSEEDFRKLIESELKFLQKQNGIGQTIRNATLNPIYAEISEKVGKNKFHGYEKTQVEDAKVVALVKDDQQINELKEGEEGLIVLDETPFYAEAGGQVGDTGFLSRESRVESRESRDRFFDSRLSTLDSRLCQSNCFRYICAACGNRFA